MAGQARITYEFRHLTISDGLPDNTVYSTMQDSRGYIWFCTANGASRFDGRRFQNFTVSQGLADSEILGATEDFEGRIWFHTINGRLCYFDTKTEQIISYRSSELLQKASGNAFLTTITEGRDSSVWMLFERHSLKRLLPNGTVRHYDIRNKRVTGLFEDDQKCIFLAGDTFRLYDVQRDSFVDWAVFSKNGKNSVWGKLYRGKDFLFFEAKEGIFTFRDGVIKKIISRKDFNNPFLRSISADTLGNLWIGVTNGGVTD